MFAFVLLVGTMNIAVGFVAAMLLAPTAPAEPHAAPLSEPAKPRRRLPWGKLLRALFRRETVKQHDEEDTFSAAAEAFAEETPVPTTSILDVMPQSWVQALAAVGIEARTIVEAAVFSLRAETGRYREQLIACEALARQKLATQTAEGCDVVVSDLRRAMGDWLKLLREATTVLAKRSESDEAYEGLRKGFHQSLCEQTSQVESIAASIDALDFKHDPAAPQRLVHEVARLIDAAHVLRERSLELQATIARQSNRLGDLPSGFQIDATTTLYTRIGFEKTLFDWRAANADGAKPCALAMIDLDRFGKLNERLGTRAGDRFLTTIGREFARFVRKERGFDRACRIAGERFLYFLGDTSAAQALSAAERLRQSVEALTVNCDGTDLEVTVSCAVCELHQNETSEQALARLLDLLNEARKAGRNRTAIDDGTGAKVITDPQRYPVKAKTVTAPEA